MPRMTIYPSRDNEKLFNELCLKIEAHSWTEMIRRSIALLRFAVQQQRPDGTIVLKGVDSTGQETETVVLLR